MWTIAMPANLIKTEHFSFHRTTKRVSWSGGNQKLSWSPRTVARLFCCANEVLSLVASTNVGIGSILILGYATAVLTYNL